MTFSIEPIVNIHAHFEPLPEPNLAECSVSATLVVLVNRTAHNDHYQFVEVSSPGVKLSNSEDSPVYVAAVDEQLKQLADIIEGLADVEPGEIRAILDRQEPEDLWVTRD